MIATIKIYPKRKQTMKVSQLRQLIKEELKNVVNENDIIDEGWKQNILVGLATLIGSLGGIKAQTYSQNTSPKEKIEISYISNDVYQVLIGYLTELSQAGGSQKTPEQLGAIKEARKYLENLLNKETPTPLSQAAKVALEYAKKEIKNLDGYELQRLSDLGKKIKTINENIKKVIKKSSKKFGSTGSLSYISGIK